MNTQTPVQATSSIVPKKSVKGIVAVSLSLFVLLYVLPIFAIAIYLSVLNPYESGYGWIAFALIFFGAVIIPPVAIISMVFSIIVLTKKLAYQNLAIIALSVLGLSLGLLLIAAAV